MTPSSTPDCAELAQEVVCVGLDTLLDDATFLGVAKDVDQLPLHLLPVRLDSADRRERETCRRKPVTGAIFVVRLMRQLGKYWWMRPPETPGSSRRSRQRHGRKPRSCREVMGPGPIRGVRSPSRGRTG
jgi:hypothetical protein